MIKNKFIVWIIYIIALSLVIISFVKCSKYQVVSEVRLNLYHLHNPKTKDAEVILTKDTLIIGKYYRLKEINIINSPYYRKR